DLKNLSTDVTLEGKNARGSDFQFNEVRARAQGHLQDLDVKAKLVDRAGPSVEASGHVSPSNGTQLRDLKLSVARGNRKVRGRVAEVRVSKERIQVSGLELSGPSGELKGSASLAPDHIQLSAHGRAMDLEVLTQVLGLDKSQLSGKLNVDAEVQGTGRDQR